MWTMGSVKKNLAKYTFFRFDFCCYFCGSTVIQLDLWYQGTADPQYLLPCNPGAWFDGFCPWLLFGSGMCQCADAVFVSHDRREFWGRRYQTYGSRRIFSGSCRDPSGVCDWNVCCRSVLHLAACREAERKKKWNCPGAVFVFGNAGGDGLENYLCLKSIY